MKIRTQFSLGLLALGTLAMAVVFQGTLLRRTYKAGTKDVYKISSTTKVNADTPMGAQETNILTESTVELSTDKVAEDGSATINSVTTTDKASADGMIGQMMGELKIPPVKATLVVDNRNRTKEAKADGTSTNPMALMMNSGPNPQNLGLFVEFPEKALNAGDTWDVVVPKSPAISKVDQKLTATFTGSKAVDGKNYYVVSVKGTINVEPDMAELMKNAPADQAGQMGQMGEVKVKGTMEITAENLVDPATGNTVSSVSTMKGKSNVEITQMGMTVSVLSETSVKIKKAS